MEVAGRQVVPSGFARGGRVDVANADEPLGVRERKRAAVHGAYDIEECGGAAKPNSESGDDHCREQRGATKGAKRVPEIEIDSLNQGAEPAARVGRNWKHVDGSPRRVLFMRVDSHDNQS